MIGAFFRRPAWAQFLAVGLVFVSMLAACAQASFAHALWYVGLSLAFLASFALGAQITLQSRAGVYMAKDSHLVAEQRSRNDIAKLARLKATRGLTPVSRLLLIPPKALLFSFLVKSSLWWIWIVLLFLMIHLIAKSVTLRLAVHELTARQFRRDEAARKLLHSVRQGKQVRHPFLIYLRPFVITAKLHVEDPASMTRSILGKHPTNFHSKDGEHIGVQFPIFNANLSLGEQLTDSELNPELETVMEIALREVGQLIALGKPGETVGAGRIETSEDDWRRVLTDLGEAARGFVIVPSTNAGTLWEMAWLKASRSHRDCYFLLPGVRGGEADLDAWLETRKELLPVVRMPQHPVVPAMFAVDARGRPHTVYLIDSLVMTGGKSVRMFPTTERIAAALQLLSPISSRTTSDAVDEFVAIAEQFLEAIFRGVDDLLRLDTLADEFRAQASSPDFPEIFRPLQSRTIEMSAAEDEFFHHDVAGGCAIVLRREVLVDGERHLFCVSCLDWNNRPRILGCEIVVCDEDARRRNHLAQLARG